MKRAMLTTTRLFRHALVLLTTALVTAGLAGLAGLASLAGRPVTLQPVGFANATQLDPFASYEPQTTCRKKAQPGTLALLHWVLRRHPGTRSVSVMRSCEVAGTSEHKDGRAFDWGIDARKKAQRKEAYALLDKLFATDKHGNPAALARRFGIMYVIFDDTIWSSYRSFQPRAYLSSSCPSTNQCSPTLRHLDHLHFSLSLAGAAAQTSWYRAHHVTARPVLRPDTRLLDTVRTALVGFEVPTDGTEVRSRFKLPAGGSYTVVVDGLARYGAGSAITDGVCRWGKDGTGSSKSWVSNPSGLGLTVDGTQPWDTDCSSHTHTAVLRPQSNHRLHLAFVGAKARGADGSLHVYLVRSDIKVSSLSIPSPAAVHPEPTAQAKAGPTAKRLREESLSLPVSRRGEVLTTREVRAARSYRVVVTGAASSAGLRFDGSCVRYAGRWRPQHTLDLNTPDADHLSLWIDGTPVALHPRGAATNQCDPTHHRYVATWTAPVTGRAKLKVWDPFSYSDNSGRLQVRLVRR